MELTKCINGRRSIRKYKNEPISNETVTELIKAAQMAPSWKNTQVSRYYVAFSSEAKERIIEALPGFNKERVKGASAIIVTAVVDRIVGCDDDGNYITKLNDGFQYFDNGLQVENLCLRAHEMGLGTLIMGLYYEDKIREQFSIPDNQKIVTVVAVGHPDVSPEAPDRKPAEDIVKFY